MTGERTKDYPIDEVLQTMELLAAKGAQSYLKWTCPGCGERVTANEPNTHYIGGYRHTGKNDGTFCGAVYHGDRFNLFVSIPMTSASPS